MSNKTNEKSISEHTPNENKISYSRRMACDVPVRGETEAAGSTAHDSRSELAAPLWLGDMVGFSLGILRGIASWLTPSSLASWIGKLRKVWMLPRWCSPRSVKSNQRADSSYTSLYYSALQDIENLHETVSVSHSTRQPKDSCILRLSYRDKSSPGIKNADIKFAQAAELACGSEITILKNRLGGYANVA